MLLQKFRLTYFNPLQREAGDGPGTLLSQNQKYFNPLQREAGDVFDIHYGTDFAYFNPLQREAGDDEASAISNCVNAFQSTPARSRRRGRDSSFV